MATAHPASSFSDEALRQFANLRQFYEAWRAAKIQVHELNYRLHWERRGEAEYLYRREAASSKGSYIGPRNPATEGQVVDHAQARTRARVRLEGAQGAMAQAAVILAALGHGVLAAPAARILRALDVAGGLGTRFLVVGTNAMLAYELEAGRRFAAGLDATEDFDLTYTAGKTELAAGAAGQGTEEGVPGLMQLLRSIDVTYTVNTERPFQARNSGGYEVELLAAPSVVDLLPADERLAPVPLPEQEWLLRGKPVYQVVCARDRSAAPIVAPDPRWMALHKLWLSDQAKRSRLKADKDRKQGERLLAAIAERMPHYPIDKAFRKAVPEELVPYLPPRDELHTKGTLPK